MRAKTSNSQWLRVQQAADLLGVSASTVRRWADSGKLACQRTPSGQRRFLRDDLERVLGGGALTGFANASRLGDNAEQRYQLLFETSLELASSLELDRGPAVGRATLERRPADPRLRHLPARGRRAPGLPGLQRSTACSTSPGPGASSASTTGPATGSPSRRVAPSAVSQPRRPAAQRDRDARRCAATASAARSRCP